MDMTPRFYEPTMLQWVLLYAAIFCFPVGAIVLARRRRELTGAARLFATIVVALGVVCAPLVAVVVFGIVLASVDAIADVIRYGNVTPADRRAFLDFLLVAGAVCAVLQFTRRRRLVVFTAPKDPPQSS